MVLQQNCTHEDGVKCGFIHLQSQSWWQGETCSLSLAHVKTETETGYYILPLLILWGLKFINVILKKKRNSFSAPVKTHIISLTKANQLML